MSRLFVKKEEDNGEKDNAAKPASKGRGGSIGARLTEFVQTSIVPSEFNPCNAILEQALQFNATSTDSATTYTRYTTSALTDFGHRL